MQLAVDFAQEGGKVVLADGMVVEVVVVVMMMMMMMMMMVMMMMMMMMMMICGDDDDDDAMIIITQRRLLYGRLPSPCPVLLQALQGQGGLPILNHTPSTQNPQPKHNAKSQT